MDSYKLKEQIEQMNNVEKMQLVTPCGYCCLSCPAYVEGICSDDGVIEKLKRRGELAGIPGDKLIGICKGCRPAEGNAYGQGVCRTYDCCVNEKDLNFCYECERFPCLKLAPIAKNGAFRPHNSKIYNLLILKKIGLEAYIIKSGELWSQFYTGNTPVDGDDVKILQSRVLPKKCKR